MDYSNTFYCEIYRVSLQHSEKIHNLSNLVISTKTYLSVFLSKTNNQDPRPQLLRCNPHKPIEYSHLHPDNPSEGHPLSAVIKHHLLTYSFNHHQGDAQVYIKTELIFQKNTIIPYRTVTPMSRNTAN